MDLGRFQLGEVANCKQREANAMLGAACYLTGLCVAGLAYSTLGLQYNVQSFVRIQEFCSAGKSERLVLG